MEIQEALNQIKQVSSILEAFRTVEDLLTLVETSQASVEGLTEEKGNLERVISEERQEMVLLDAKYKTLSSDLQQKYEVAKDAAQESLRSLKDGFNKELEAAKIDSHGKITELTEKVSQLKVETKNLDREIKEKQAILDDLNKSVDAIKSRLGI